MIVVRLQGRLGNQMFQYATGRSLAERHGAELVLDTSWTEQGTTAYELGFFDLGVRACPVWEVARVPNRSPVVRALQRLRPSSRPFLHVLEEPSHDVIVSEVLTAPDETYLVGFWQFEVYFEQHEALVREAFAFPSLSAESEPVADAIDAARAPVGVHVRRGDYAVNDLFAGLDPDYYARAAAKLAEAAGDVELFVFSDDPRWCAEELRFEQPATIVERLLPPERHWEDLALMTRCRHHVIANSSYGWWGAWLAAPGGIVVAPRRWVRADYLADPVPDRWLRV